MDISTVVAKPRTIDIVNPSNGEPTGFKITLASFSSPKVKAAQRAISNARLQSRKGKITAERVDAESIDLICSAVDGWEWGGESSFNGDKLEFNKENVYKIVSIDWIRKQLDDELGDDAAFFKS